MTDILQSHPHHFPSSPSSITLTIASLVPPMDDNDGLQQPPPPPHENITDCYSVSLDTRINTEIQHQELEPEPEPEEVEEEEVGGLEVRRRRERKKREREEGDGDQLSLLTVLVTVFRKSLVAACNTTSQVEDNISSSSSTMKISWPTNVRHVSHVTFDRFNGFLGLPVEFEPEVPRRPPSASTRVFGVSTESMQLSFDSRGNSVPTILLMMQRRLYAEGGLQAEGIFRINPDNGQEEYVREQLNKGVVPDDVDIHCLAGLIKAWFRELPTALLDCLSPEEVMQAQSEEQCTHLVTLLPPTEASLLNWAVNLMADVAQLEHLNKMNARNIAMVFAPNMTKMADPLTALMFAVQVMNFLKTLIERTLRNREDSVVDNARSHLPESPDENEDYSALQPMTRENDIESEEDQLIGAKDVRSCINDHPNQDNFIFREEYDTTIAQDQKGKISKHTNLCKDGVVEGGNITNGGGRYQSKSRRTRTGQLSNCSAMKTASRKVIERPMIAVKGTKESSIISRINSQTERVEAWR